MMRLSRGFVCALAGLAMTLFAWYGPWAWPSWPAFAVEDLVFGNRNPFSELSYPVRAAVLVALIVVNVSFWGTVAAALFALWKRIAGSALSFRA